MQNCRIAFVIDTTINYILSTRSKKSRKNFFLIDLIQFDITNTLTSVLGNKRKVEISQDSFPLPEFLLKTPEKDMMLFK